MQRSAMIFFDLDGPILDVSAKYYRVYHDLLDEFGFPSLPRDQYWEAKRNKVSDESILRKTGAEEFVAQFVKERKLRIEADSYLALDKIQAGASEVLEALSRVMTLVLVTLRSSPHHLHKQLGDLHLSGFFQRVLSSNEPLKPRWRIKHRLITEYFDGKTPPDCTLVGDTETDINAGNRLGFATIAVTNGIRTRELLLKSNPDHMVRDIRAAQAIIQGEIEPEEGHRKMGTDR